MVNLKRAYDAPVKSDGYRVLVDRLWPRGLRKQDAHFDAWMKEVSPSTKLRQWFGHRPDRWPEFRDRYAKELRASEAREGLRSLAGRARGRALTLVYSARDADHNNAVVLKEVIERLAPP